MPPAYSRRWLSVSQLTPYDDTILGLMNYNPSLWATSVWTLFEHRRLDEVFKAPFYQYSWLLKTVRFRSAAVGEDKRNVEDTAFLLFLLYRKLLSYKLKILCQKLEKEMSKCYCRYWGMDQMGMQQMVDVSIYGKLKCNTFHRNFGNTVYSI